MPKYTLSTPYARKRSSVVNMKCCIKWPGKSNFLSKGYLKSTENE